MGVWRIKGLEIGEMEKRFYDTLRDVFVGAEVEGQSGYIKMMKFKAAYFNSVFARFREDVDEELKEFPEFREELFDKLYTFFKRYFSESGSIHYAFTPLKENIWAKVYTGQDVALFWKTGDLYYVKTDRIWRSMNVPVDGLNFYFDASKVEHLKTYEKREIIYEFDRIQRDGTLVFNVQYSERGRKTRVDEILRELGKNKLKVSEETLERAFRIFEKQNEVDYFINKNANAFLKEQFDAWLKHYVMDVETVFTEKRLKQLKTLKVAAYRIIDFISQFEDELRRIWEKPKFVLNSNYVITLDRMKELCGEGFLEEQVIPEVLKNEKQLEEWKEIFGEEIKGKMDLFGMQTQTTLQGKEWKKLPIDTKNFSDDFKWILIEKINENHELDKVLDGWLIKSENWQALNTILPKFREKVQTIYIDPPFNKEQDADYFYHVKYKDSTWITMLENRLNLAKEVLKDTGSIFVRCDYNGNMYVRLLMNEIFVAQNFVNQIAIRRVKKNITAQGRLPMPEALDNLFVYFMPNAQYINLFLERYREGYWRRMDDSSGVRRPPERIILGRKFHPAEGRHFKFSQKKIVSLLRDEKVRLKCKKCGYAQYEGIWEVCPICHANDPLPEYFVEPSRFKTLDTNWTDIYGYSFDWNFPTENSETLLRRVIESTSNEGDLVMDFFLGIGTTTAVAHKLKRKWIGVEMGEHFFSFQPKERKLSGVLIRMKEVLACKGNHEPCGISKEVNWQGGGFFKYYELEQYEQSLDKAVYKNSFSFTYWDLVDVYSQYVFLKDEKMLRALEIDYEKKKVKVDLSRLYPNLDVAETISNLKGKWIKKLTRSHVEYADGEVVDLENPDWKTIKPLIWW